MTLLAIGGETMNEMVCANKDCHEVFTPKTHNQIYHDDECCRQATNRRIMEKYYANRDRKLGKARWCNTCHTTKLSRYNESMTCAACSLKNEKAKNSAVVNMIISASLSI